jgi:hypothetical protein
MANHWTIIRSAAIVLGLLGSALPALANCTERSYGGAVQTWQDIQRSKEYIQNQIKKEYHTVNAGSAYGSVSSPKKQHHAASHKQGQDR